MHLLIVQMCTTDCCKTGGHRIYPKNNGWQLSQHPTGAQAVNRMGKKRKNFSHAIIFSVVLLSLTSVAFYYLRFYNPAAFRHYKAFGIDIPENYSVHGLDVSRYQKKIRWQDVADMNIDGVSFQFVFVKATEGTDIVDPQFSRNWRYSKKTRLVFGAYHYFICSKSGKAQAVNYIRNVDLQPGQLPPVVDIEECINVKPEEVRQRLADWLFMAERAYKTRPIIYTNLGFYKKYLAGRFDDYPLWIAHYKERHRPRIQRDWQFWQYNEAGRVDGIDAWVDFNVFNGDSTAFQKFLIK